MNTANSSIQDIEIHISAIEKEILNSLQVKGTLEVERTALEFKSDRTESLIEHLVECRKQVRADLNLARERGFMAVPTADPAPIAMEAPSMGAPTVAEPKPAPSKPPIVESPAKTRKISLPSQSSGGNELKAAHAWKNAMAGEINERRTFTLRLLYAAASAATKDENRDQNNLKRQVRETVKRLEAKGQVRKSGKVEEGGWDIYELIGESVRF